MEIYKVTRAEITVYQGRNKRIETNLLTSLWTDHEKALKHARWHSRDFGFIADQYKVAQVTKEPYLNVYVRIDTYHEEDGRLVLGLNATEHCGEVEDGIIYER